MKLSGRVQDRYRDWIHQVSGVYKRKQAWEELRAPIVAALEETFETESRTRETDIEALAYSLFVAADEALTDAGDKAIKRAAETGLIPFDLERLEALVALGEGDRVKFGDMGMEEYRRADERHYANVRNVQMAYDEWRRTWAPYLPHLDRGLRVREVEERGLL